MLSQIPLAYDWNCTISHFNLSHLIFRQVNSYTMYNYNTGKTAERRETENHVGKMENNVWYKAIIEKHLVEFPPKKSGRVFDQVSSYSLYVFLAWSNKHPPSTYSFTYIKYYPKLCCSRKLYTIFLVYSISNGHLKINTSDGYISIILTLVWFLHSTFTQVHEERGQIFSSNKDVDNRWHVCSRIHLVDN